MVNGQAEAAQELPDLTLKCPVKRGGIGWTGDRAGTEGEREAVAVEQSAEDRDGIHKSSGERGERMLLSW
jgi:hypothetical protein